MKMVDKFKLELALIKSIAASTRVLSPESEFAPVRGILLNRDIPIIYPKQKIYQYNNEDWRKQGKRKMKVR